MTAAIRHTAATTATGRRWRRGTIEASFRQVTFKGHTYKLTNSDAPDRQIPAGDATPTTPNTPGAAPGTAATETDAISRFHPATRS
jgi:hypothetical protein